MYGRQAAWPDLSPVAWVAGRTARAAAWRSATVLSGGSVEVVVVYALRPSGGDPPAGLEELRGVLLREHAWRQREGL